MLEKNLESPLDSKEIKPVNIKGNQPWILFGRTDAETEALILWPSDANSWLIGKDPDAWKDWRQKEKRVTEDEIVGWHHRFNGHEFGQTLGDGEGQGSLACCSPRGREESDKTWRMNNNTDIGKQSVTSTCCYDAIGPSPPGQGLCSKRPSLSAPSWPAKPWLTETPGIKRGTWTRQLSCPGTSLVVQWLRIHLPMQRTWVWSVVEQIPWSRKQQPTPVFLPGKFHRQRSLVGYSRWGHKESDKVEHVCHPSLWRTKIPDASRLLSPRAPTTEPAALHN